VYHSLCVHAFSYKLYKLYYNNQSAFTRTVLDNQSHWPESSPVLFRTGVVVVVDRFICMYVYMCICVYVFVYWCIHVYVYTYSSSRVFTACSCSFRVQFVIDRSIDCVCETSTGKLFSRLLYKWLFCVAFLCGFFVWLFCATFLCNFFVLK